MPSSNTEVKITDVHIRELSKKKIEPAIKIPEGGESTMVGGQNIVTIQVDKENTIDDFSPQGLDGRSGLRYSEILGGSANHDARHNSRFRLSELARGPLSVEAEEEERIQKEVEARLAKSLEEIRTKVEKQGYEEGFARGKEDAKQELATDFLPKVKAFEELTQAIENGQKDLFKANEDFLIKLVYRLAQLVVLKEIKEDADYTRRLVTQILERVGTRENIKIFVAEKAYSSADALKEGLAQSLGQLKNISVEVDTAINGAGCRVETEFGEIDARIEVQLQNIAQAMGSVSG